MASPVFKTGVTRPSRVGWVRFPHSPATMLLLSVATLIAVLFPVSTTRAQVTDTTRADTARTRSSAAILCKKASGDTVRAPSVPRVVIAGERQRRVPECRVPLSPRAALIRSMLVPGLGQYQLLRPKATAIFAAVELGAIGMSFKSKHDLDLATAARRDTTIVGVVDSLTGKPVIDPKTGLQKTIGKVKNQDLVDRIKARRTHLEDWVAGIVFNHLFSGADAWVAANLADFDANVNVTSVNGGRGIQVAARIAW